MTHLERVEAVERFLRAWHSERPAEVVRHVDLEALLDVRACRDGEGLTPETRAYYHAMTDVRTRFIREGIAFDNEYEPEARGYKFLSAAELAKRNRDKWDQKVAWHKEHLIWCETYLARVDAGEEPGLGPAEFLLNRTYTENLRRAISTYEGQQRALDLTRAEERKIDRLRTHLERDAQERKEQSRERIAVKQRDLARLRALTKRQADLIERLGAEGVDQSTGA